jgi:autotransporter-associated beta strand protein
MFRLYYVLPAVVLALAAPPASAQYTWTGGGADANWTTAANWSSGTVPVSSIDAAVTVAGSTNLSPNQNVASPFLLNALDFDPFAGSFTLGGSGMDFRTNSANTLPTILLGGGPTINEAMTLTGALTVSGGGNAAFAGVIGGASGLTFNSSSFSTLTLSAANSYSGPTVVNAGTLLMNGTNGAAASSSGFTANFGGTLSLDNTSGSNANRIGGAASVTLNGGTFKYTAASGGGPTEVYGNLNLPSGSSSVVVNGTGTLASTGAIVRSAGALTTFTGNTLGTSSVASFATPPTLVGAGGGQGTPTISIIPYALASNNGSQYELATYGNGGNGVRPLTAAEYATNNLVTSGNILVNSLISGGTVSVNALKLQPGGGITGAGTLTVNSGLIYTQQAGGGAAPDISVTTLAFGSREAIIRVSYTTYMDSAITGSGGLTVDSPGNGGWDVVLRGVSSFTGGIQAHTALGFSQDASLGASTNTITLDRPGTLAFVAANYNLLTSRAIALNGGGDIGAATGRMLTVAGAITGTGPLQIGGGTSVGGVSTFGTVELTGTANSYTGGTTVDSGGTLRISTETVLPAGTITLVNGTLQAGAPFTYGRALVIFNSGSFDTNGFNVAISGIISGQNLAKLGSGTLSLSGANTYGGTTYISAGTLSVAADANLGATGTSVSLSGATFQPSASFSTARPVSISSASTIDTNGQTLTLTGTFFGSGTFTKAGAGTLAVTGNTTFTGNLVLTGGVLGLVSDPATALLTFNGGSLQALAGFASNRNYVLGNASSTIDTNGFNVSVAGTVSGSGGLTKIGSGTLILSATDTYTGPTIVNAGRLVLASQGSTSAFTIAGGAALQFAGPYNLGFQALAPAAGGTVEYSGATITGGFLYGPGTHSILAAGATFTGTTSFGSAVLNQTGPATFMSFTNGGALNLTTGATLTGFTNQGSGSITIGAASKVNAADFQSYGTLTLNPAVVGSGQFTELVNTGSSPLYFNGGSRTFIGTPGTTGPPFVAGVDVHGQNLVIAGGLFVNNGFVTDSTTPKGSVIVDFGALYKGAGTSFVPVITQNGGKVQAGNSPGSAGFGRFVFGPGGVNNYVFAIDDATGTAGPSPDAAGHVSGWGLVRAVQQAFGGTTSSGDFVWTATPTAKLTFAIDTLVNPTTVGVDVAGPMADFDPNSAYSWPAVRWAGTYSGPTDSATLNADTAFDTSGFLNPVAGTFGWNLDPASQTLSLVYTPTAVPEPGTLALLVAGIGMGFSIRRGRGPRASGLRPSAPIAHLFF